MTRIQIIEGEFQITDPEWPVYRDLKTSDVITSDEFTKISGDPTGLYSDAALGGVPDKWQGDAGGWEVVEGVLHHRDLNLGLFMGTAFDNYKVEVKLHSLATVGEGVLQVRREKITGLGKYVSLFIEPSGASRLRVYDGTTVSSQPHLLTDYAKGDVAGVSVEGGNLSVLKNGEVVRTYEIPVLSGNFAGLAPITSSANTGFAIENIVYTKL